MSLVVFQHEPRESAAMLGKALAGQGHTLRVVKLFAGDKVPVDLDDVDGVVSMGGAANVDETGRYAWIEPEMAYLKKAHEAGKPIVGVCLGAQLIAAALGGKVAAMAGPVPGVSASGGSASGGPEVGWKPVRLSFPGQTDVVLQGIPWDTVQFHLHGQEVTALPPDSTPLAGSKQCKMQAYRVGLTTYAFQYHFEWDRADIAAVASDPLVLKAGEKPEQIIAQAAQHFDAYRRLGDRLCDNLATFVFPVDRR